MDLLVLLKVGPGAELLVAEPAWEGLLARVYPLVADQIGDLGKKKKWFKLPFLI